MDLIGPGSMEPHFTDAWSAVQNLPVEGQWVDLGSGAGFPGIALAACYSNAQITLIESRHKRAIFLKQVIQQAKVSHATVLCERTERVSGPFNGVISRAYKPPLEFLEDADRLTDIGGYAVCLLGEDSYFQLPAKWTLVEEVVYPISEQEGSRKRWLLQKGS
jgi:16S rRNA (guanine527-N7)-methyltransferase